MKRLCSAPRCGSYATYRGQCAQHSRQRERQTKRKGKHIYNTKRWKLLRRKKLMLDPICQRCMNRLAQDVHHIHGVEQDPWSLDGLESLCHACHSSTTRAEQAAA